MYCFVILLLFNEMQMSVRRFSAIPHLRAPQAVQESLMFLKRAQVNKGERVLHIIDFIDKLVPNSDEHTISEVGSTRLLVSFGSKKPKLESVSLAQWVIGNTRIFHTLLQLGRLPSQADVKHYLDVAAVVRSSTISPLNNRTNKRNKERGVKTIELLHIAVQ